MLRYALFGPNAGQFIDVPDDTATAGVTDGWLLDPEQMGNPMEIAADPDHPYDWENPPASITEFYKEAYNIPDSGDGGGGEEPPTPVISSLDPATAVVGAATTVTIFGTDFANDATVQVDGSDVVSSYVSATEMSADLPSAATAGVVQVTVKNVADNKTSAPKAFTVTAA